MSIVSFVVCQVDCACGGGCAGACVKNEKNDKKKKRVECRVFIRHSTICGLLVIQKQKNVLLILISYFCSHFFYLCIEISSPYLCCTAQECSLAIDLQ